MTTIITGNFEQQAEAKQAMADLANAGFTADQTSTFFVSPIDRDDLHVGGGHESPVVDGASVGAVSGAVLGGVVGVAVGLVTLPALGPGAAIAAAGVGAYVGSLGGALIKIEDKSVPKTEVIRDEPSPSEPQRKAGTLVAVSAPASAQQDTAIGILRAHGATDIEHPQGTIVAGQWTDFNPLTPLELVSS